tara:strand:+ start:3602 stop:4003 length:402 start_codon:yes stop_codon:yes gene_type:complete
MKLLIVGLITYITIVFALTYQKDPLNESIARGKDIYTDFCINCHLPSGLGQENIYPPLAKSDYLTNNREASIKGIKYGQEGNMTVNGKIYNNVMAPMGLTNLEVADVMNYITNNWGNTNDKMITQEEVSNIKK